MSDLQELDNRFAGDAGGAVAPRQAAGQATQVEQARAIAEVRAAVMIAMDRPRDRTAAIAEMRDVCAIQALADRAFFRVQRGKEKDENGKWHDAYVNGETIHLARELARCWGNIDYGVKELARDDIRGQSELLAFAWDLERNARSEITFVVPHARGSGEKRKRLVGTQEIYENNASFAGRRLREAIFAVLPVWFKAEAAEICRRTLDHGGGKPLPMRIADLRAAFEAIGVTVAQLEKKRGRKIDDFLPEDVGALRVVYGSLKREEVTVAEEFPSDEPHPQLAIGGYKLDALEKAVEVAREADAEVPFEPGEHLEPEQVNATKDHGASEPRPEGWYVVDFGDKRRAEYELRQKIAAARDIHEVDTLQNENIGGISGLGLATRNDILELIAVRANAFRDVQP